MIEMIFLIFIVIGWVSVFLCAVIPSLGIWVWTRIISIQSCVEERLETFKQNNPFLFKQ